MRWKLFLLILVFCSSTSFGQFSSRPVVKKVSWNTANFDSYQYDAGTGAGNMWFRLMEPNGFVKGTHSQKYPLIVFFHGAGESGTDNDKQLYHGAQRHEKAVLDGEFPGFLFYPQSNLGGGGWWTGTGDLVRVKLIIDQLIKEYDVDPTRIYIHGLSMGGGGTWRFLAANPTLVATAYPMADASNIFSNDNFNYTPLWLSQGGKDATQWAKPWDANSRVNTFRDNKGGEIRYLYFPTLGHTVWNATYSQTDFFTNMLSKSKLYIVAKGGQTSFCPGTTINLKIGISPGFAEYRWEKSDDNSTWSSIPSSNVNEITVTQVGYYKVQFRFAQTSIWGPEYDVPDKWTDWSAPLHIDDERESTPPTINSGGRSVNLPALDGSTSVNLQTNSTYNNYQWSKTVLPAAPIIVGGNSQSLQNINQPGSYTLKTWSNAESPTFVDNINNYNILAPNGSKFVPVEYRPAPVGCPSSPSNAIMVTTVNGPGVPNAPNNFLVTSLGPDKIKINWDDKSDNENGFEIYRALTPGGPYVLVTSPTTPAKSQASNPQYINDTLLTPNTTYYYRMRAVNDFGGSTYTPEKSVKTDADLIPPTPPLLVVSSTSRTSIGLTWSGASDNVGIASYEIYMNGVPVDLISGTLNSYTVTGLTQLTSYTFYVKTKDTAGNSSIRSNIVSAATINNGLNYSFYTHNGISSVDQIETNGTLVKQGIVANFDLSVRTPGTNDYFGFVFSGNINIPTSGNYRFYTRSDDGSKLYIDGILRVNNDGLHGSQERSSSSFNLTAGSHDIRVLMFEQTGGEILEVRWEGPGISKQLIPDSAFKDTVTPSLLPLGGTNLIAAPFSGSQINLSWTDSPNETEYEIYQSINYATGFSLIAIKNANITTHSAINLLPITPYYYKITATNGNGSSGILNTTYKAFLDFEGNLSDGSPNGIISTISSGSPTYTTDNILGTKSISFTGSGQYVDLDVNNNFIHNQFYTRSVAFWLKANNTNDNQILFEEGGSTNGFGLRIKDGKIQGVAQSNNSITTINSVSSSSTNLTHVALVFNNGNLKIYINGYLESSVNASFTNVISHTDGSGIGARNGSTAFDSNGNGFNGNIDGFYIYDEAITADEVHALFSKSLIATATTQVAEAAPATPTNFSAQAFIDPHIQLSWLFTPANVTGFEVDRTTTPTGTWTTIATLGPTANNYDDTNVLGNKTYYYRIRALGLQQNSPYTDPPVSATTANGLPVFTSLTDRSFAAGGNFTFDVIATDPDGDVLTLNHIATPAAPSVIGFANLGNGLGRFTITIPPASPLSYAITVTADDGAGSTNGSFVIYISSNNSPVITSINDLSMTEGTMQTVNISATDTPDEPVDNPDLNIVVLGSSTAEGLLGIPSYNDSWVYKLGTWLNTGQSITNLAKAGYTTDHIKPEGAGIDPARNITKALTLAPDIIILNLPSNDINVNTPPATTQANYTAISNAVATYNTDNGKNVQFFITTTQPRNFPEESRRDALETEANWIRSTYGNAVIDTYDELTEIDGTIKDFYDSGDGVHLTAIGHTYIYLQAKKVLIRESILEGLYLEVQNLPAFGVFTDNVDGTGTIEFSPGLTDAGTYADIKVIAQDGAGGYDDELFTLIVTNDNSSIPPIAPSNLTATALSISQIRLSWQDNSSDEDGFDVFRSLDFAGPYDTKINGSPIPANTITIDDIGLSPHTTYYYKVVANKGALTPTESNVASAVTLNTSPVFTTPIADVFIRVGGTKPISLLATDSNGDAVSFVGSNLPSFASIVDNGNGTGTLNLSPTTSDIGTYGNLGVVVQDGYGGTVTESFFIIVEDDQFTNSIYVNFGSNPGAGIPWNNTTSGIQNYNNLLYADDGTSSSVSMLSISGWGSTSDNEYSDPSNNGVYDNAVVKSNWKTTNATPGKISFTGLNGDFYTITIFGSDDTQAQTIYRIGAEVPITLNTLLNASQTAVFSGIAPSGNQIDIDISASSGSGVINAIVLNSYSNAVLFAPTDLTAKGNSSTEIELNWTDNSGNETGFEIWRRRLPDEVSPTLIETTLANIQSFTDNLLMPNTLYEYQVRAVNVATESDFTPAVVASTLEYLVKVNINEAIVTNEPGWNNIEKTPLDSLTWDDLIDDALPTANNTGINLTLDLFETGGSNDLYGNTGGDLFPDNVAQSYYFLDKHNTSAWRLTGLDATQYYDITFFGSVLSSRIDPFLATGLTEFEINGQILELDTKDNTTEVVEFTKLIPDANGEIEFKVYPNNLVTQNNYAHFNAMLIKVYRNPDYQNLNDIYYAEVGSNISTPDSWNTNVNGTGTDLISFTEQGNELIILSDQTLTVLSDLSISGAGTIVKVTGNAKLTVNLPATSLSLYGLEIAENVSLQISASDPLQINIGDGGLIINNGATLDIGASSLVINGSSGLNTNNQSGLIASNKGSISINSSSALNSHLVMDGSMNDVNNLTVHFSGGGELQLESTLDLTNVLKMQAGTLNTKDNLVIVHNADDLGMIDKVDDGASIIGQVDYHRYWDRVGSSTAYGAYHFGVPVKGQTLLDWNSDFYIQGTNFTFGTYSNISKFDETKYTYSALKNGIDPVSPGRGFSVFIFQQELYDGIVTYNNVGEPVIGDGVDGTMTAEEKFDFEITYTDRGAALDNQGWNLIANPYPCIIDLNLMNWDEEASGLFKSVYVYNSAIFTYEPWVDGDGSFKLMPGQGFYVKAESANPVLTISEDAKVTDRTGASVYRIGTNHDKVTFELVDPAGKTDKAYLKFNDDATEGIDLKFDAPLFGSRLISTTENITQRQLLVNALPRSMMKGITPLNILTKKEGGYTLNMKGNSFTSAVLLYDKYLNQYATIGSEEAIYNFHISSESQSYQDRFELIMHPIPEIKVAERKSYKNEMVSLPFYSKNILDATGLSMEISWNPDELEFVGLDSLNVLLSDADFDASQSTEGTLILNHNNELQSFSDLGQLFTIQFKPIVAGIKSHVSIAKPVAHIQNGHEFDLNMLTTNGLINVFNEKLHYGSLSYKGRHAIKKGKLKLMPIGTELETNNKGAFEMLLKENIEYSMNLESTEYDDYKLNIHDLVGLNRHLMHINTLEKQIDYRSADVNENGLVDLSDKQDLQDQILASLVNKQGQSKQKLASCFSSGSENRTSSEVALIPDNVFLFGNDNISFDLVVLGDISDYEYDESKRSNYYDTAFVLIHPEFSSKTVSYTISVKSPEKLSGYQFTLNWDKEKYSLVNIKSFSSDQGYQVNEQEGTIAILWTSEQDGTAYNDFIPALLLELKNIDGKFTEQPLKINDKSSLPIFINENLNEIQYVVDDGLNMKHNIQLIKNYPNPFTKETNFDFLLNESQEITITIYNSIGEIMESLTKKYNEGFNKYTWQPKINCAKGIYFYNFTGQKTEVTGKVILR